MIVVFVKKLSKRREKKKERGYTEIRFVRTTQIKKSNRSNIVYVCVGVHRQIIYAKLDLSSLSHAFLSRQERERQREREQANNFISHLTIYTESRIFFFFFVFFFILVFFQFFSLLLDSPKRLMSSSHDQPFLIRI